MGFEKLDNILGGEIKEGGMADVKELMVSIKYNNCKPMKFIAKKEKVVKEKEISSNFLSKKAIINFKNKNITSKLFQGGGKKAHKQKIIEYKLQQAYKNFKKRDRISIQTIEDEIHDKAFYKMQIEKFNMLNEISPLLVQRYMRIGYPQAAQLIDGWERNGHVVKVGKAWTVVNTNSIIADLKEIFKEKL